MDKRKLEIGVSYEEFLYVLHSFAILYQFIVHLLYPPRYVCRIVICPLKCSRVQ